MGLGLMEKVDGLVNKVAIDKFGNYEVVLYYQPTYAGGKRKGEKQGSPIYFTITIPQASARMDGKWVEKIEEQFRVIADIACDDEGKPYERTPLFLENGLHLTQDKWEYDGKTYTKLRLRAAPWTKVSTDRPERKSNSGGGVQTDVDDDI